METSGANMKEQWVKVIGFDEYEVSDIGRIRNILTSRLLGGSNFKNGRNYWRVALNGKPLLLHRVVLCSFSGVPLGTKSEVMHLDNNGYNNRLENLKFGTHAENMKADRGNNHSFKGENNKNAKLTENSVKAIRAAYLNRKSSKWGRRKLAETYGITETQVGRIALSQIGGWTHVN